MQPVGNELRLSSLLGSELGEPLGRPIKTIPVTYAARYNFRLGLDKNDCAEVQGLKHLNTKQDEVPILVQ